MISFTIREGRGLDREGEEEWTGGEEDRGKIRGKIGRGEVDMKRGR